MSLRILFSNLPCELDDPVKSLLRGAKYRTGLGRSGKYVAVKIGRLNTLIHRYVFALYRGKIPDGKEIDHIDRNPLNNRIDNLRAVSRSENHHNRGLQSNNTSGHRGVRWYKAYSKWSVNIKKDGISRFFGYFSAKEDAIEAARIGYIQLFGNAPK